MMYLQGYDYWFSFIFCVWNYWLCRLLDPDLDMMGATTSESTGIRILRRVPLVGWLLLAFWVSYTTFYAALISSLGGHRSWASHSLIVGTIGRIIFFNIPMWVFIYWERLRTGNTWDFQQSYIDWRMDLWLYPYYLSQFIFLGLGDSIHLLLDTQWVKGVLYNPKKSQEDNSNDYFKPKYKEFVRMSLLTLFGYFYNNIFTKIFRKR